MSTLKPNSCTRLFLCIVFVFFQCQLEDYKFLTVVIPRYYPLFIYIVYYPLLLYNVYYPMFLFISSLHLNISSGCLVVIQRLNLVHSRPYLSLLGTIILSLSVQNGELLEHGQQHQQGQLHRRARFPWIPAVSSQRVCLHEGYGHQRHYLCPMPEKILSRQRTHLSQRQHRLLLGGQPSLPWSNGVEFLRLQL